MTLLRDDRRGRPGLDQLARVHDGEPIGQRSEQREVVADVEAADSGVGDEVAKELGDPGLRRHVEAGRRLVEDQDVRVARERDGKRDSLLLAAAELEGIATERARRIR